MFSSRELCVVASLHHLEEIPQHLPGTWLQDIIAYNSLEASWSPWQC